MADQCIKDVKEIKDKGQPQSKSNANDEIATIKKTYIVEYLLKITFHIKYHNKKHYNHKYNNEESNGIYS